MAGASPKNSRSCRTRIGPTCSTMFNATNASLASITGEYPNPSRAARIECEDFSKRYRDRHAPPYLCVSVVPRFVSFSTTEALGHRAPKRQRGDLRSADMGAAASSHRVGDDVRRLTICLRPRDVRPTEEVRVSSPRLLQMRRSPIANRSPIAVDFFHRNN